MGLIVFLLVGLIAGYVANRVLGHRSDLLTMFLLGVLGALVGGFVFWLVGLQAVGILGKIIVASFGATLVLYAWQRRGARHDREPGARRDWRP